MERKTELQQAIYEILLTQIKSGAYRYMENLPTLEEASKQFNVSIDTARVAYYRLKQEGYISFSKNVRAKVIVHHDEQEIDRYIQNFFADRKDALMDLGKSLRSLFGRALWISLKHASPVTLNRMEELIHPSEGIRSPFVSWQLLDATYSTLGNELLMRLIWQVYLFFYAPFYSIVGTTMNLHLDIKEDHMSSMSDLCHKEDWGTLQDAIYRFQDDLYAILCRFYEEKVTVQSPELSIPFCWDSYKKSSQLCYSLAMELLLDISHGKYPVGSYLPAANCLAAEKGVSIHTVRRAVSLLVSIGSVKSSRTCGALVLPHNQSTKNCDFADPVLQRRLLDMTQSVQILALSCRAAAELTLTSLNADIIRQWKQELIEAKDRQYYDVVFYIPLSLIARYAPLQSIRTIYSELLRQFFWGNVFRGMKGDQRAVNAIYAPYFDGLIESLTGPDISQFSVRLEDLMTYVLRETVEYLRQFGISGTEEILIPDESEC